MKFHHQSLLALAIAASTLSPLAMAATTEQPKPPASHEARMAHANPLKDAVVTSWNLDDDKLASLAQADSELRAGLRKLHGDADDGDKASPDQRRAAMESLLQKQREQLANVLTDEQLHAYQMLERPRPPMMRHHGGLNGAGKPGHAEMAEHWKQRFEPLFISWDLSEQQTVEVMNAERSFFDGLHQLKRPQAEASDRDRDARGVEFRQLLEQRHATLSEALDEDQLNAYEALTQPPKPAHGSRPQPPTAS